MKKTMKRDGSWSVWLLTDLSASYRKQIVLWFQFPEEASHFIANNFILALIFQSNEYNVVRVRFAIIR